MAGCLACPRFAPRWGAADLGTVVASSATAADFGDCRAAFAGEAVPRRAVAFRGVRPPDLVPPSPPADTLARCAADAEAAFGAVA